MENDREEIFFVLNDLGLDEEEISSINRRNKLLDETTLDEVNDIVDFFKIKLKIDKEDIARIIIKNPFILNESFSRIDALTEIYEKVGFSEEEYREYIVNFDKAFSLNPKEVLESISGLLKSGKDFTEIRKLLIEDSSRIF